jgi:GAF domain-containing protein
LKVIASSPSDVQPVFEAIASTANRLIGGFSTAVYRVIDDFVHLMAFASTNPESNEALKAVFPLHRSEVPSVALVQKGETTQIADAETADAQTRRLGPARGWRSVTFTPLTSQGAFFGFIACMRRETGVLADHHVQLLRIFADQAVIAIQNAQLSSETKEALEHQTATAEVLKVISSSAFNLQTVLDTLVESATRLCEAQDAIIFLPSGEVYRAEALHGYSVEYHKFIESNPIAINRGSVVGRTAIDRQVVHISDVLADPNYTRHDAQRMAGFRTALGVPLLREGNVVV